MVSVVTVCVVVVVVIVIIIVVAITTVAIIMVVGYTIRSRLKYKNKLFSDKMISIVICITSGLVHKIYALGEKRILNF